jgi:hypothetical protein
MRLRAQRPVSRRHIHMAKPLCFVLVPLGSESTANGRVIDFDRVYDALFAPAIEAAGLQPIRPDEGQVESVIHTAMFERLVLCEYAVVDLTIADANVFYEVGVRHATRRATTVLTFAQGCTQMPFDAATFGAMPYEVGVDGIPLDTEAASARLAERFIGSRNTAAEMSLYQLLEEFPDVAHEKTDVFLERVGMPERHRLEIVRRSRLEKGQAIAELRRYEKSLEPLADVEAGVLVALFLAFRELQAYADMIRLVQAMPAPLSRTVLVREQYAFALNRAGRGEEAEAVLKELLAEADASSELYSLLGRVYKDRYDAAREAGDRAGAHVWLERAAETYLKGFEIDWRDDYPGVNALTLLAIRDREDPRLRELLPVVRYAAHRRVARGVAGYWSQAALVELAVLAADEAEARAALDRALAANPSSWMREATLRNLRLLREGGVAPEWSSGIEERLRRG